MNGKLVVKKLFVCYHNHRQFYKPISNSSTRRMQRYSIEPNMNLRRPGKQNVNVCSTRSSLLYYYFSHTIWAYTCMCVSSLFHDGCKHVLCKILSAFPLPFAFSRKRHSFSFSFIAIFFLVHVYDVIPHAHLMTQLNSKMASRGKKEWLVLMCVQPSNVLM